MFYQGSVEAGKLSHKGALVALGGPKYCDRMVMFQLSAIRILLFLSVILAAARGGRLVWKEHDFSRAVGPGKSMGL
jgi:hypothetical protein